MLAYVSNPPAVPRASSARFGALVPAVEVDEDTVAAAIRLATLTAGRGADVGG